MNRKILIYGPCADEYSLSKVNRYFAKSLADNLATEGIQVILSARESDVGRLPRAEDYSRYPYLQELYQPFSEDDTFDLLIYNNFPKDPNALYGFASIKAAKKVAYLAWEEDRFPARWVNEYNQHLTTVFTTTSHTKVVLKRSGVNVPIVVVPNAVAMPIQALISASTSVEDFFDDKGKFVFLHISSGLDRKSPDLLIEGYVKAFSGRDDVLLAIKSFPSAGNKFPDLVERFRNQPGCPEIFLIDDGDLTEEQMYQLYKQADCYLSPSKAEGFNLPVLEAMAVGTPIVTTAWSGQMDFCRDEYTYLVDYDLVPARSHLDNPGAFWAEPRPESFINKLQQVVQEKDSPRQKEMIALAQKAAGRFTWENSAKLAGPLCQTLLEVNYENLPQLKVITTYNSICGIAEYSSFLYPPIANLFPSIEFIANRDAIGRKKVDPANVIRKWQYDELDFTEILAYIDAESNKTDSILPRVAHIQYNLGFYTFSALEKLIVGLQARGVDVVLTPHAVRHKGAELSLVNHDVLSSCKQIQVLSPADKTFLEGIGLRNVVHIPHGNTEFTRSAKSTIRERLGLNSYDQIVATHGFMVEKKGLIEALESVALLKQKYPNLLYLAVNAVNPANMSSQAEKEQFSKRVQELGLSDSVIHLDNFLEKEEVLLLLAAADLSIFAYPENKEAASGAVRLGFAVDRPVIVTHSNQLSDLGEYAYTIADNEPQKIAAAVENLLSDKNLYTEQVLKQQELIARINWDRLGIDYLKLISNLTVVSAG